MERDFRHRFTPQKELERDENSMNFSFAEWQKRNIKRSPTSLEIKRKPMIREFYNNEQKKLIKIHRSFDHRKDAPNSRVEEMNKYIKRLISEHAILKHRVMQQDQIIRILNEKPPDTCDAEMNSTPYFTKLQSKARFPRDVFSSRSKKFRVYG